MTTTAIRIREQLPPLTAAEYCIYQHIRKNLTEASHQSIRALAHETNTSTSTVLRLVKKFGCDGYAEFRLQVQEEPDVFRFDQRRHDLYEFFGVTSQSAVFEKAVNKAASILSRSDEVLFSGDRYGKYALDTGIRLFGSGTGKALYMDLDCQIKERRRGTCAVLILGSSTKEETEALRHTLPVGKIPLIVIYCGGEPLRLPCDMIDCRPTRSETAPATSLVPAVHILEELRKRMNRNV